MNQEQDSIAALLRLKRHERPPEGYYEDFLREFRRRQRVELMKPSLRELLFERLADLWPDFRIPAYAYGAVGLLAISISAWILTSDELAPVADSQLATADAIRMELHSNPPAQLPNPVEIPQRHMVGSLPPHHALPTRPATKDEPFSF